jgi:UPF0716 family protein affecting phage T7 exclusion
MGLIYFLIYLFLEIIFSYEFMRIFTPFGFFLEILLTAGVGVYILQTLDLSLSANMHKLMKREITQEEFLSIGLFKLIGAVLLVLPGFFSDIIGVLFLFEPFSRIVAKKLFPQNNHYHKTYKDDDDIIDVEIIEEIPKKD